MLATNQILHKGRYRIINSFDENETGAMYEAYDTVSNTNVVLRESVGNFGKVANPTQMEAINAEFAGGAQVLTKIKHESLVSVQDYFSEIDRQYLVLEAVTGSDLSKFIDSDGDRPSLSDVLTWADQLLSALSYLETLSPPLVHSDIKPENIKLTSGSKVKLLTAAISTHSGTANSASQTGEPSADAAFNYRPLEQLWAELNPATQRVILNSYDEKSAGLLMQPLDARSDIYSLAASLYHVLTGSQPVDALDRSIAILDGKPDPLKPLSELDGTIPQEISEVFMSAMAIRREERFESAELMLQILQRSEAGRPEGNAAKGPEMSGEVSVEAKDAAIQSEIASAEAELLEKQTKAEERQRELMAEQARLAEEQRNIEKRRNELETEKEQLRVANKLAELEAEQARRRAEEERLELEAEDERQRAEAKIQELQVEQARRRAEEERLAEEAEVERKRAESRLQEIEAERERHRAEQKRIETAAKEESERAEKRFKELSEAQRSLNESSEDDQNLLEIEPAGYGSQNSDEDFELHVTDVPNGPSHKPASSGTMSLASEEHTFGSAYADMDEPSGSKGKVIAMAVAAVVLLGVTFGAWKLMSGSDATPPAASVQTTMKADQPSEPVTIPSDSLPAANTAQPVESEPTAAANTADAEQLRLNEKNRQLQLNAGQVKKPAPTPAKTPPPAKKVTVDDLIHDN